MKIWTAILLVLVGALAALLVSRFGELHNCIDNGKPWTASELVRMGFFFAVLMGVSFMAGRENRD